MVSTHEPSAGLGPVLSTVQATWITSPGWAEVAVVETAGTWRSGGWEELTNVGWAATVAGARCAAAPLPGVAPLTGVAPLAGVGPDAGRDVADAYLVDRPLGGRC